MEALDPVAEAQRRAHQNRSDVAAWSQYAQLASAAQDWPRAAEAFAQLHALAPFHPVILRNWLRTLEHTGQTVQAITIAARWLDRFPDDVAMWRRVVSLARTGKHVDTEESAHRNLARLEPDRPEHVYNWACALLALNRTQQAREVAARGREKFPNDIRLIWFDATAVSAIMPSREAITAERSWSEAAHDAAERWLCAPQGVEHGYEAIQSAPFYFAYHGVNDAPRAARAGSLIQRIAHAATLPSTLDGLRGARLPLRGRRIRIAFVSSLWYRHTVGHYFGGWVRHFDRERFEVALGHDGGTRDDMTEQLESSVDTVLRPKAGERLFNELLRWAPDVIVYVDVGMVARHIPMYAYRLAPLQLAAWGHPCTTGHPEIDGFISCAEMEPPDARKHYSERELILLPGIGVHYAPPPVPAEPAHPDWKTRFGIPRDVPLLCCPQSLFKIHPDDDALFASVLAAQPSTHLVFFDTPAVNAKQAFLDRFHLCLRGRGVDPDRVHIIPQQARPVFMQILQEVDCVLDTHHFSGGSTSLDTLACGTPIVTWPGEFMRGRQTAAMLRLCGLQDDVTSTATDYLARVAHWLTQPTPDRLRIRAARRSAAAVLWNDLTPVRALEREILERVKD